jgi:hypothetical protein
MNSASPDLATLIALRTQWREFHQKQDRENADEVFRRAGVELVTDRELNIFPELFREKLNDFGRDWERAIAAQARKEGYVIYRTQLLMEIDRSQELQAALESFFAVSSSGATTPPIGAPLFFESNGLHAVQNGVWDCLFYFVLHIGKDPAEIRLEDFPGVVAPPKTQRIA